MKFTIQFVLAAAAGIYSATTLANPIIHYAALTDIAVRTPQRMTIADRFSNSDLEYLDWANKMVDEGKMWWPNRTSVTFTTYQTESFSLSNIACGFMGGNHNNYEEGEAHFCNLINEYVSVLLVGAEWAVNDLICQDGDPCLLLLQISLGAGGGFVQDGIPSFCSSIFEEVYNSCNGAVGGTAQIVVNDSEGQQTGFVEAQWFSGESDTCPNTDDTFVCGTSLGN